MSKLVQCVPNFSEGRRVQEIEGIVAAIKGVPGVKVLDFSRDESHNRSVVTFLGEPEAVLEGAFQGAREAARVIDMSQHKGICWSYLRKESGRWPGGGWWPYCCRGPLFTCGRNTLPPPVR